MSYKREVAGSTPATPTDRPDAMTGSTFQAGVSVMKAGIIPERQIGKLFFRYADTICVQRNIVVEPESDRGQGPVDFKFTRGDHAKVLLELKRLDNPHIIDAVYEQLPQYLRTEFAHIGYFLVVRHNEGQGWDGKEAEVRRHALRLRERDRD
jgi:hypothetical protein